MAVVYVAGPVLRGTTKDPHGPEELRSIYGKLAGIVQELGLDVAIPHGEKQVDSLTPQEFLAWVTSAIGNSVFVVSLLTTRDLSPPVESVLAQGLGKPQCLVVGDGVRPPRLLAGLDGVRGIVSIERLGDVGTIIRDSLGQRYRY